MKVVILHQHFNTPHTGGAIRSYYLARALADQGVEVTVITGFSGKTHKVENIEGFTVQYLPIAYHNNFGFFRRSLSFIRYVWQIIWMSSRIKQANVCYAISVPLTVGLPALYLKWRYNVPFIFEVGDLWPEAPIQMGFIKNSLFKKLLFGFERTIYRQASEIVALSPAIASAIHPIVPAKKIHLVPNMGDTDFFKPEGKDPLIQRKFKVENKFVVSYVGAIGLANGLEFFVACAQACEQARLPIHFLMCGEGAMLNVIRSKVDELALSNFSIIPFQNRQGVKEILQITDAVFICYKALPVLETGSPNKYFDGLAAGKLIIVNFEGWVKEEIEQTGCGIYIDPAKPETFVEKVPPFLYSEKLLKQHQYAARVLAETQYSRSILSGRFAKIFDSYK